MSTDQAGDFISVVIPIYNEETVLPELYRRLKEVLQKYEDYEVIFVNDGSTDRSHKFLQLLRNHNKRCKIIDFSRNFGHQIAITAGLHHASGDAVIVMDGDLQDPPELIHNLTTKWREGNEVVFAQRMLRHGESTWKLQTAKWFYRLMNKWSDVKIPLDTGDFRLLDRKVVNELNRMDEKNRFIRGMVSWIGFKQAAVPYDRHARFAGKAKYSFRKSVHLAWDGITSFSSVSPSLPFYFGCLVTLISVLYALVLVIQLTLGKPASGFSALLTVMVFLGGVQLVSVGVIGQYIARIFDDTKNRPLYVVRQRYGFHQHDGPPVYSLEKDQVYDDPLS